MSRSRPPYIAIAWITLAVMAVLAPLALYGAWQGLISARNAPVLWLPPEFPERRDYEQFEHAFNSNDVIVVSWDGCTVDDERLKRFGELFRSPAWDERRERQTHLTGPVLTGYEILRELMAEPLDLSREEASRRLRGQLVGRDGRTSCALLETYWIDSAHNQGSIELIHDLTAELGIPREDLRLAGSSIEGAAVDAASNRSFTLFLPPAVLTCVVLCWWFLGSWRLMFAVLSVAGFSAALVLGMIFYTGGTLNAVLVVLAPLMLVLATSAGIHLVNYYIEQVRDVGVDEAPRAMLQVGWRPCSLAAGTTAIGLTSLVVSDIIPVQQFGVFGSIGLAAALGLLFLVLPGAVALYGRKGGAALEEQSAEKVTAGRSWLLPYAAFIRRRSLAVAAGCIGFMLAAAVGLAWVGTSVNVYDLLPSSHSLIRDYAWMEQRLGPLVPIEVIVRFEEDSPLDILQRAALVREAQAAVEEVESVDGAMSAVTFAPTIPTGRGIRETRRRSVIRTGLRENRELMIATHWLAETPESEMWRITARSPAFRDVAYARVLVDLRRRVEPVLDTPNTGATVTVTGVAPVVQAAQQQLLVDLFSSFLTAFGFIAVVMMLLLRSVTAGLAAMIPNIFPAMVLFGLMGWLGVKVDIGTVMTASVAMGIAVDDTIHYLSWFRRGLDSGLTRLLALEFSLRHCGRAMMQTTTVCGVGLLVFGMSEFIPTRRFAGMMFALLMLGLVADLLLLPALLAGPLGRIFERKEKKSMPVNAPRAS
ncbi:MAG: MMPL family transporter [Planctomycetes bacterium]|nr:MMPL family transporter [Planctomycetota bacterium]